MLRRRSRSASHAQSLSTARSRCVTYRMNLNALLIHQLSQVRKTVFPDLPLLAVSPLVPPLVDSIDLQNLKIDSPPAIVSFLDKAFSSPLTTLPGRSPPASQPRPPPPCRPRLRSHGQPRRACTRTSRSVSFPSCWREPYLTSLALCRLPPGQPRRSLRPWT